MCLTVVVGLASGQEEGNTVGAIPGQAGRDYPNFQVKRGNTSGAVFLWIETSVLCFNDALNRRFQRAPFPAGT